MYSEENIVRVCLFGRYGMCAGFVPLEIDVSRVDKGMSGQAERLGSVCGTPKGSGTGLCHSLQINQDQSRRPYGNDQVISTLRS